MPEQEGREGQLWTDRRTDTAEARKERGICPDLREAQEPPHAVCKPLLGPSAGVGPHLTPGPPGQGGAGTDRRPGKTLEGPGPTAATTPPVPITRTLVSPSQAEARKKGFGGAVLWAEIPFGFPQLHPKDVPECPPPHTLRGSVCLVWEPRGREAPQEADLAGRVHGLWAAGMRCSGARGDCGRVPLRMLQGGGLGVPPHR